MPTNSSSVAPKTVGIPLTGRGLESPTTCCPDPEIAIRRSLVTIVVSAGSQSRATKLEPLPVTAAPTSHEPSCRLSSIHLWRPLRSEIICRVPLLTHMSKTEPECRSLEISRFSKPILESVPASERSHRRPWNTSARTINDSWAGLWGSTTLPAVGTARNRPINAPAEREPNNLRSGRKRGFPLPG